VISEVIQFVDTLRRKKDVERQMKTVIVVDYGAEKTVVILSFSFNPDERLDIFGVLQTWLVSNRSVMSTVVVTYDYL
jgi:hypothetical protein